jgi:hypothetical protein
MRWAVYLLEPTCHLFLTQPTSAPQKSGIGWVMAKVGSGEDPCHPGLIAPHTPTSRNALCRLAGAVDGGWSWW